jgi:phosphomannomutase
VGYVRDSFVGMALILASSTACGLPVSRLVGELPAYHILKDKVVIDQAKIPQAFAALERRFGDAQADRLDGLRLDWPNRWLLVRASNTEPIVRIICEAPNEAAAREIADVAAQILAELA